jgi:hypothetical protein
MSKRDWTGAVIGFLAMAGTLAAQPDLLFNCRNRVSVAVNVPVSRINVMKRGSLDNGNSVIWWDAKVTNSHTVNGFCEVNPLTGRTVRLETSGADSKDGVWRYRITPQDAERVCQREARERFSPGNGMLEASFLRNMSSKSTYRVAWQYGSVSRMIRKGRCDIDSSTGTLVKIHADTGWW